MPSADGSELADGGPLPAASGPALDCPHAAACPGCPLIGAPYAAGLGRKRERLEGAIARYPELGAAAGAVALHPAESFESYRVRAKLVCDAAGRLGLYAAGSHDVVDLPGCRVLAPELAVAARALRALLPLEIELRGVDLRLCDRGVLVTLLSVGRPEPGALDRARRRVLDRVPALAGLALNVAAEGSVQLLGPELEVLWGAEAEPHHLVGPGAPWHYASHGAFTQVHAGQAARLHGRIEELLRERLGGLEGRRVLELYAGSGALALRLAARGAQVVAVEAFAPAVARLREAAGAQRLAIEASAADAERFLGAPGPPEALDVVLVNPPRRGLAPGVRAAIARRRPRLVLYVSCEPETLARDLSHLALLGYGRAALEAFDMIPLSDAVEALALLEPLPPPAPRVLYEDARSIALLQLPFEPTTPDGGSGLSLLARARASLGLPELTPVHRLEAGVSGLCWFARRPADVAPLAGALAEAQLTYLALARGVTHARGTIRRPLRDAGKPRPALTRYRRLEVVGGHSLLELTPERGPRRQLQRHLASIGHPILGDSRHGDGASNRHFEHRHGLDRPFLHLASLQLPLADGAREISAPLPGDLAAVLDALRPARG